MRRRIRERKFDQMAREAAEHCSECGVSREVVRDNHAETCPEVPPEERPTQWETV